jgi:hypothetical protein
MSESDLSSSFRLFRLSDKQVEIVRKLFPDTHFRHSRREVGKYSCFIELDQAVNSEELIELAERLEAKDADCDFFLSAVMDKPSFAAVLPKRVGHLIQGIGVGGIVLSFTYLPSSGTSSERETLDLDCLLSFSCQFFRMTGSSVERIRRRWPSAEVVVSRKEPSKKNVIIELGEGKDYSWIREAVEDLDLDENELGFLFSVSTEYDTRIYDVPMHVVRLVRSVGRGRLALSITVEGTEIGKSNVDGS